MHENSDKYIKKLVMFGPMIITSNRPIPSGWSFHKYESIIYFMSGLVLRYYLYKPHIEQVRIFFKAAIL